MRVFLKLMTFATVVAMSLLLVECSDNNGEPGKTSKSVYESVTTVYSVNLSDAYFEFYDVNVVYTDADGQITTATIVKNQNVSYNIPAAKLPENIRFSVMLNLKNPLPPVDENVRYTFSDNVSFLVIGNKSDGKTDKFNFGGVSSSMTLSGSKVPDYLNSKKEKHFGPYECSTVQLKNQK